MILFITFDDPTNILSCLKHGSMDGVPIYTAIYLKNTFFP